MQVPINKNLYSASYILITGGISGEPRGTQGTVADSKMSNSRLTASSELDSSAWWGRPRDHHCLRLEPTTKQTFRQGSNNGFALTTDAQVRTCLYKHMRGALQPI